MTAKLQSNVATVYRDSAGEWRWRFENRGQIMADSGEGYAGEKACVRSLKSVMKRLATAEIIIKSGEVPEGE